MKNKLIFFLFLSFLEGGSVMAAELLGAKMMAPYFGSSLYVWSAVMAVTLFGLAAGYFTGGILSEKKNPEKTLYRVMVLAAIFTISMPFISKIAFLFFGRMSLEIAVTISSLMILFPPVFMMGTVSPLIISNISQFLNPGRASGTVYAISTVGGIIATFIYGFIVIPNFGLVVPSVITGILLGIIPLIKLFKMKDVRLGVLLILFSTLGIYKISTAKPTSEIKVVFKSEGILGQIIVLDFPNDLYYSDSTQKGEYCRWMFVNRISQTMDDKPGLKYNRERYFTYVYKIAEILDTLPKKESNVLLLGLGGGSIAKHLNSLGFNVEACELDKRMEFIARTYFDLPEEIKVTIDDARHFINGCDKKYDVIIFDTFKGEETPSHIFTEESLEKVKSLLTNNGLMIVNSFGFIDGELGLGTRSIFKTILASGMSAVAWPTSDDIYQRNIEFIACKNPNRTFSNKDFITQNEVDLEDAFILKDDHPRFELINAKAAMEWRRMSIESFFIDQFQRAIPLFE